MARSLDAILAELEPGYSGSRNAINTQLSALPAQYEADLSGLNAQLKDANDNILSGARQRGLGFSGIPVGEQARYAATNFAPAVARLKSDQIGRTTSLQDALNSLDRDRREKAVGIRSNEEALDEQRRQFDAKVAFDREMADRAEREAARARAASGSAGFSLGGGGGGGPSLADLWNGGGAPKMSGKAGAFKFTDANGRPVSALTYSQLTGQSFRSLLQQMANAGDRTAKAGLGFFGNDGRWNNKINAGGATNASIRKQLSALNWR